MSNNILQLNQLLKTIDTKTNAIAEKNINNLPVTQQEKDDMKIFVFRALTVLELVEDEIPQEKFNEIKVFLSNLRKNSCYINFLHLSETDQNILKYIFG